MQDILNILAQVQQIIVNLQHLPLEQRQAHLLTGLQRMAELSAETYFMVMLEAAVVVDESRQAG
jgi:hypothetical protein